MKIRFLRASYFIWLIVPIAIIVGCQQVGLPYFRWSYEWRNGGQGYDPYTTRHYTRCTYIGIGFEGNFTENDPLNGKCSWFRFSKMHMGEDQD